MILVLQVVGLVCPTVDSVDRSSEQTETLSNESCWSGVVEEV